MAFTGTRRFELIRTLGAGGMGVVYEAYDRERDMPVALKVLRSLDATDLYRFKREFRALSDISHPNVVGLYELVSEGDDWFFTMELVEGVDFVRYVRRSAEALRSSVPPGRQAASPGRDKRLAHYDELVDDTKLRSASIQLAQALNALHRAGIVHRDLKPSNVLVTPTGRVVLMDFGITSDAGTTDDASGSLRMLGTPEYLAPEQATSMPSMPAADWYSFGVMLYLAVTGRLPLTGERYALVLLKQEQDPAPAGVYAEGIPPSLAELCGDLLCRDPSGRPTGDQVLSRLGAPPGPDDFHAPAAGPRAFVGREAERKALLEAYSEVRRGHAVCCLVSGSSGIGKSSLVHHFFSHLLIESEESVKPIILLGRCHERESVPYKAFDTVLDHLSRELLELDAHEARRFVPEEPAYLARLFPVLRLVPGIRTAELPASFDTQEQRSRAYAALRELLRRLAAWRPLVLFVDDLQWVDEDSADLLTEVLREPGAPPVLVLAAMRSEDLDRADESGGAGHVLKALVERSWIRRVDLAPLNEDEQRELAALLMGGERAQDELWRECAGSPFFLGELVRYAKDTGRVAPAAGLAALDTVLYERISRLDPEPRGLLEAVAVAGEPAPVSVLADAVGLDGARTERAAARLRGANMVRMARHGTDVWLAAYHDRIRETLDERLDGERKRRLHRELALAFERSGAGSADALARHWTAAGDADQAKVYLLRAARDARAKLAPGRAADLVRAALDLGGYSSAQQLAMQLDMAEALAEAGRFFEAASVYDQAARVAPAPRAADLTRLCADNYLRSGHLKAGRDALYKTMAHLGIPLFRGRRRVLLSFLWLRLRILLRGTRFRERAADQISERERSRLDSLYAASTTMGAIDTVAGPLLQSLHLLMALELGDKTRVCRALAIECVYLVASGGQNRARALLLAREVDAMAREVGDPYVRGVAKLASGATAWFTCQPRKALERFTAADALFTAEGVGAEWERGTGRFFACHAQILLGDLAAVAATAQRLAREARRRGDVYTRNQFLSEPMTWCCLLRDDPEAAWAAAEESVEDWPQDEFYIAHHLATLAKAITHIYRGEHRAALDLLNAELPDLRRIQFVRVPWAIAPWHFYRARAAMAVGDDRAVRRMIRHWERQGLEPAVATAEAYRAFLLMRRNPSDQHVDRLASAKRVLERHGFLSYARCFGYRLGELIGGEEGRLLRDAAVQWASRAGAVEPVKIIAVFAPEVCVGRRLG